MAFLNQHSPETPRLPTDLCIVIRADRLLIRWQAGTPCLPLRSELGGLQEGGGGATELCLGSLGAGACWAAALPQEDETPAPAGLEWCELRAVTALLQEDAFQAISCARELLWWERRNRFCGCCGQPTQPSRTERALVCQACKTTVYPVIAPAVIVAITRGDTLLLAHNKNFRPGLHSLIAGFVDPGETLEQCVTREAHEETGVCIRNPRYLGSQPWPYPNSLMLGFHAEHESGEIAVDGVEIEHAAWFRRDALPEIPSKGTVARRIIDVWLRGEL
jgi:NAD+ diphosphatase